MLSEEVKPLNTKAEYDQDLGSFSKLKGLKTKKNVNTTRKDDELDDSSHPLLFQDADSSIKSSNEDYNLFHGLTFSDTTPTKTSNSMQTKLTTSNNNLMNQAKLTPPENTDKKITITSKEKTMNSDVINTLSIQVKY